MLCARRKLTGETISAYFANRHHAPFVCPDCNKDVILKAGRRSVNHFAHVNPQACENAQNESEDHRRCKLEIFEALRITPGVSGVALEQRMGENRADVFAYIRGVPVAIEVQISSLSLDTIMQRTIGYHRSGVYVLWLLQWSPKLDSPNYAPKIWEKWIHAAYFGQVFYWTHGLTILGYHFDPRHKSIPRRTFYSAKGKPITVGGYSKRSIRYRSPVRNREFNLVEDFAPKERYWWESKNLKVPDAKIFTVHNR